MRVYGEMCGWTLPAHARSGDAIAIGAYLGGSDQFDLALRRFAHSYAAQNEKDYSMLSRAVKEGRIIAQVGCKAPRWAVSGFGARTSGRLERRPLVQECHGRLVALVTRRHERPSHRGLGRKKKDGIP